MAQERCHAEAPQLLRTGDGRLSRCFYWNDVQGEIWGEAEARDEVHSDGTEPVLTAKGLRRFYGRWQRKYLLFGPRVRPPVRAVTDVDFQVGTARTLGIVGESGSGKTTVAWTVVGLVPRDRGEILLREETLASKMEERTRQQQAALRMVFQNPSSSLNPKLPVRHAILRSL
jgi:ABC-type glutathione transport system ATPase component